MVDSFNRRNYLKGVAGGVTSIGIATSASAQGEQSEGDGESPEEASSKASAPSPYAPVVEQAAVTGGAAAENLFRTGLDVEYKEDSKAAVVTDADRAAQATAIDTLTRAYPDAPIIGEEKVGEATKEVPSDGLAFTVDPIDGSYNYTRGNALWCTSVAAIDSAKAVAAATVVPERDDIYTGDPTGVRRNDRPVSVSDRSDPTGFMVAPTYWWGFDSRDQFATATGEVVRRFSDLRRYGSTQLALAAVAAGEIEAAITNLDDLNPWDTIAGAALVEWAGGTVTDLRGNDWCYGSRGLVASNGRAHAEVVEATQQIEEAASE
ncbi:inositol monophosphatase family protein [Halobium salinum]|uniref:fructose-bisphosphatase n=1 Tax=Halobium salinum TaxID=1364940 RepID=A0ABD5PI08_9EURY|nr:inositol monophosphatase [Halobium salinum]